MKRVNERDAFHKQRLPLHSFDYCLHLPYCSAILIEFQTIAKRRACRQQQKKFLLWARFRSVKNAAVLSSRGQNASLTKNKVTFSNIRFYRALQQKSFSAAACTSRRFAIVC